MNMISHSRIFLVIFLCIGPGFAPCARAASHRGDAFKEMRLANFEQLMGRFKQKKILKEMDVEIKTEGHFQVLRQGPSASIFRWDIEKPKPSHICIDSVGIVIDSGEGEMRKKKNLKFSEVGKEAGDQIASLLKIITMDQSKIADEFDIQKQGKVFVLTPKNKEGAFFASSTLDVGKSGLVQSVVIQEKSKDEIHIDFVDMKTKDTPIAKDETCVR
jgi:hypothetical protein